MTEDDRCARAALSRISEPGDLRLGAAVAQLGAARVLELLREQRDVSGLTDDLAVRLAGLDPAADLTRAADAGIRFVCPGDAEWPAALDDLAHAEPVNRRGGMPLGLWVRGPADLAAWTRRAVSVVGSRSATTYGADVAGRMAAHLADAGVTVISGAAYGIDVAAHRGALAARGPTIAVLACGVDRAYPSGNRAVIDYIATTGALVSELPPGCSPTRLRFLTRNRLIAALATGTVVVEAAVRSGALSTAHWATRLGRVLAGVPGPVTSAPSAGVHELLRTGEAQLVASGEHVLELVSPAGEALVAPPRAPETVEDRLDPTARQVLEAVPLAQPAPVPSIARTAGVAADVTAGALDRLVEAGLVARGAGGWRRADSAVSP